MCVNNCLTVSKFIWWGLHNAHVFIIRPFVQLFWCSLVLFFVCVFCFGVLFVLFFFGYVFFRSCSFILFFWQSFEFYLFTVADFLPVPKCGCIFRFFSFSSPFILSFPFLSFRWSAISIQVYSLRFAPLFSVFHSLRLNRIYLAPNYLCADVNWPFSYFSPLQIFKYTTKMCSQYHRKMHHMLTQMPINFNRTKMWYSDCNYECNRTFEFV